MQFYKPYSLLYLILYIDIYFCFVLFYFSNIDSEKKKSDFKTHLPVSHLLAEPDCLYEEWKLKVYAALTGRVWTDHILSFSNKVLTEGGHVLLEHGGSFRSFISQAGSDARKMVELIVAKIPSYRDEATYEVRVTDCGVWRCRISYERNIFKKIWNLWKNIKVIGCVW